MGKWIKKVTTAPLEAIANAEVSEVVCALINDKGKVCKLDSYIRPVEEEIND